MSKTLKGYDIPFNGGYPKLFSCTLVLQLWALLKAQYKAQHCKLEIMSPNGHFIDMVFFCNTYFFPCQLSLDFLLSTDHYRFASVTSIENVETLKCWNWDKAKKGHISPHLTTGPNKNIETWNNRVPHRSRTVYFFSVGEWPITAPPCSGFAYVTELHWQCCKSCVKSVKWWGRGVGEIKDAMMKLMASCEGKHVGTSIES